MARESCGGDSSEETVVDLVDLGGVTPNVDVGGVGPDADGGGVAPNADGGGVTPNADVGGVGPNAEAGGVTPSPDAGGATRNDEAGGAVGGEEEIRCASPGHGGGGGVTFAEVSLGEEKEQKEGGLLTLLFSWLMFTLFF